jgi:hypothetical protein
LAFLKETGDGFPQIRTIHQFQLRADHLERVILISAHLEGAKYNDATEWPDVFDPEEAGATKGGGVAC